MSAGITAAAGRSSEALSTYRSVTSSGAPRDDGELATTLCVGLVSEDEVLVQRIGIIATRASASLIVASDTESIRRMMLDEYCAVRVIDRSAQHLVPPSLRECVLVPGRAFGDGFVLLVRTAAEAPATALRTVAYPRNELGQLLQDLATALPVHRVFEDPASKILGETPAIRLVRDQVRRVARFRGVSILILGETGTGKELIAQAIHELSSTAQNQFIAINCAAIPEHLFESELFGHEAGAYTGARGVRVGLLEDAAGGTVFLDEIAEMPLPLQAKLLRALEARTYRRVGSNRDIPLRARIVSATNRAVNRRNDPTLRADLYYRLAGFSILIPPLRERTSDIDDLAREFLRAFRNRYSLGPIDFSDRALEALHAHSWPGNVRELRSVVEQAAIIARDSVITVSAIATALESRPLDLPYPRPPSPMPSADSKTPPTEPHASLWPRPPSPTPSTERPPTTVQTGRNLREIERDLILEAYATHGGNISRTAHHLGIPRSTLRARLRRYGAT